MPTETSLVATLTEGEYKVEIYSSELPGEFTLRYLDGSGELIEEEKLTGVSTYRQREPEILERLHAFAKGVEPPPADLASAGEY